MTKKSRRPLTTPSGWLKRFPTRKTTKRLEVSGSIEWRHALLCDWQRFRGLYCSLRAALFSYRLRTSHGGTDQRVGYAHWSGRAGTIARRPGFGGLLRDLGCEGRPGSHFCPDEDQPGKERVVVLSNRTGKAAL